MGTKLKYRMGSFYRVDDRTGFAQRAEQTRKEWTGLIVDQSVWERRQPQDFVRGVKDQQAAPEPRPRSPDVFVGPIFVALAAAALPGATVLSLTSVAGISNGDNVGVMLDNGVAFNTTIAAPPAGTSVTLAAGLPWFAASGNLLTDYRAAGP